MASLKNRSRETLITARKDKTGRRCCAVGMLRAEEGRVGPEPIKPTVSVWNAVFQATDTMSQRLTPIETSQDT